MKLSGMTVLDARDPASELVLALSGEVRDRLSAIAAKTGRSLEECGQIALDEFIAHWEDYLRTLDEMEAGGDERPQLKAVND